MKLKLTLMLACILLLISYFSIAIMREIDGVKLQLWNPTNPPEREVKTSSQMIAEADLEEREKVILLEQLEKLER